MYSARSPTRSMTSVSADQARKIARADNTIRAAPKRTTSRRLASLVIFSYKNAPDAVVVEGLEAHGEQAVLQVIVGASVNAHVVAVQSSPHPLLPGAEGAFLPLLEQHIRGATKQPFAETRGGAFRDRQQPFQ